MPTEKLDMGPGGGCVVDGWWMGGWVGGGILHFRSFEPQSMLPPRVTDLPVSREWVGDPVKGPSH